MSTTTSKTVATKKRCSGSGQPTLRKQDGIWLLVSCPVCGRGMTQGQSSYVTSIHYVEVSK